MFALLEAKRDYTDQCYQGLHLSLINNGNWIVCFPGGLEPCSYNILKL